VNAQAVPNQEHGATQVAVDGLNKSDHIDGVTVMVQQLVIHPKALLPGCHRQGAKDAQPVVSVPGMTDRRLADRSPNPPPHRLQQKATFIQENQASLSFGSLFLAGATRPGATARWRLRPVREHDAPASAGSSRVDAAAFRHSQRGSSLGTVAQSASLHAGSSNRVWGSPKPRHRHSRRPAKTRGPQMSIWVRGPDGACLPGLAYHHLPAHLSNASLTIYSNQPPQPLPSTCSLALEAGLQSVDELPTPRDFQEVSCSNYMRLRPFFPLTT